MILFVGYLSGIDELFDVWHLNLGNNNEKWVDTAAKKLHIFLTVLLYVWRKE